MSFRLYDVLEETYKLLEQWKTNPLITKEDVIMSTRERVLLLMTHVISTPLIGTAFAYPGDIPHFQRWVMTDSTATNAAAATTAPNSNH